MVTLEMIKTKKAELEEMQKKERLKEEYKRINLEIYEIKKKNSIINKIKDKLKEMINNDKPF